MTRWLTARRVVVLALWCGLLVGVPGADLCAQTVVDQIILSIAPDQIIGQPLAGPAQLLLLDENSDLVTDYDITADPIVLTPSRGTLSPSVLDDPAVLSGGIIDLAAIGITFAGATGPVSMSAANATVTSSPALVTYSGYDIVDVTNSLGAPLASVLAGLPMDARVTVVNRGAGVAIADPGLTAYFVSGGGSVQVFFDAASEGRIDTVVVNLPTGGLTPGDDTLVFILESTYATATGSADVADTLRQPVVVLPEGELTLAEGSLRPDSVYAGVAFDLSFDIATSNLPLPFDSAYLSLPILNEADSILGYLYDGPIDHAGFESDTIRYVAPGVIIDPAWVPASGWYRLRLDYALYVADHRLQPSGVRTDSLLVLPSVSLNYEAGTLTPRMVASGGESFFRFVLDFVGSEAVLVDASESLFRLQGTGFTSEVSLVIPGGSLDPGTNLVETESIFIPTHQLGRTLSAQASLVFAQPGVANRLTMVTDFGGETVDVEALAVVQIVETFIVSPNAPMVNTGQSFQVLGRIANVSTRDMESFYVQMVSDGTSQFTPLQQVAGVPAEDTLDVVFEVIGSPQVNRSEIFRIDIASLGVSKLLPIDNIAQVTVQQPADLSVSFSLRGATNGYVVPGESFDLLIELANNGEADVSAARFQIATGDIYLGLPDSALVVEEEVTEGVASVITFTAPQFDTVIVVDVNLIEWPVDFNTGLPAPMSDSSFQIELAVTSLDAVLLVEAVGDPSNLTRPDGIRDIFELEVTNPGISSVTDLRLEAIHLYFFDRYGQPVSVRSVFEIGSTGLYSGDRKLTTAIAGENILNLTFNDYIIEAGKADTLVLRAKTKAEAGVEFFITLETPDVYASFASGPLLGMPVLVTTPDGEESVLVEVFTSVVGGVESSLVVRSNPFSPLVEPAEFRYFLKDEDEVAFRIVTLAGELVHERILAPGHLGAAIGENTIFWDGRNDRGDLVVNGVYVAVISTTNGRERAIIKLAVMK